MQFKVKKINFLPIVPWGGKIDYASLPDEVILEGELLEGGGTVEKCCVKCVYFHPFSVHCANLSCECHNKKEKKCPHGVYGLGCALCFEDDGTPTGFNRETPKEEVQLPEKMLPGIFTLGSQSALQPLGPMELKINEILTYLASKEKK